MLRYANHRVIHANRRLGYFPEPDAYGTTMKGRSAPLWKALHCMGRRQP
jgi:hypothetical protein